MYKTLDYWSRDMSNLNFSEKGLGLISPAHSVNGFSKKKMTCYVLLTDQVSLSDCWLPLLLEILGNICTIIVC